MVEPALTAVRAAEGHPVAVPADRRPIAMIVHSYYEEDPRVRREAEALVEAGWPVDVFALRRPGDPPSGILAGVQVRRLNVQRHQGAGVPTYLREYLSFLARSAWALAREHRRRHYALVQVHSLPDFLVVAALPLRAVGVPVILDLHEAMPEFFRSRFPRGSHATLHRLLLLQERLSIALSTVTITVNDALRDRLIELGLAPERVVVVSNSPSLARFDAAAHPVRPFMADGTLRLVYAGALTPTYELEVAIDAVARLVRQRPGLEVVLDVYGRGDSLERLQAQAAALGVAERIVFHGRIPLETVPAAVAGADIGLAPTRRDRFTDVSLSTKIFEYGAMGKPVVASRLPMVERAFPVGSVLTYEPGDADALAACILCLVDEPATREAAVTATAAVVREASWEREAERYCALVGSLAGGLEARLAGEADA
jgi:glycosyltransferase involved in cell wall biosynthesis